MTIDDQGKARIFDISVKEGSFVGKPGSPQRSVTMGGTRSNNQKWSRFRTWQAHKIVKNFYYVS